MADFCFCFLFFWSSGFTYHANFLMHVLGIELRSSGLFGKHFTD